MRIKLLIIPLICILFLCLIPSGEAKASDTLENFTKEGRGVVDSMNSWLEDNFGTSYEDNSDYLKLANQAPNKMFNEIFGGGVIKDAAEAMGIEGYSDKTTSGIQNILKNYQKSLNNVFALLACLFVIWGLVMSLVDQSSRGDITLDIFFRAFSRTLVTCAFIFYASKIAETIGKLGMEVVKMVVGEITETGSGFTVALEFTLIEKFTVTLSLLTPWIACAVAGIAIRVICYSLVIEIYLRQMLIVLPVSMMGMSDQPLANTNAMRFIKSLFGCYLREVIIILILVVVNALTLNAFTSGGFADAVTQSGISSKDLAKALVSNSGKAAFSSAVYSIAGLALIFKADSFVKEALD